MRGADLQGMCVFVMCVNHWWLCCAGGGGSIPPVVAV
jgi:hypothetical protein